MASGSPEQYLDARLPHTRLVRRQAGAALYGRNAAAPNPRRDRRREVVRRLLQCVDW